jgi:hypothetical protein
VIDDFQSIPHTRQANIRQCSLQLAGTPLHGLARETYICSSTPLSVLVGLLLDVVLKLAYAVKVPFALQPKAREERIEVLEKGVQLEDDGRLTVGAVPTSRCKMMLVDFDVVRETPYSQYCHPHQFRVHQRLQDSPHEIGHKSVHWNELAEIEDCRTFFVLLYPNYRKVILSDPWEL